MRRTNPTNKCCRSLPHRTLQLLRSFQLLAKSCFSVVLLFQAYLQTGKAERSLARSYA